MPSARDGLVAILKREKPDASLDVLKDLVRDLKEANVEAALTPVTSLYSGWYKKLVAGLGIAGVVFAFASILFVQANRNVAFWIYGFWAIAPPAWFFVEWAWIFEWYGDPDRTAQFKTSVELAQKLWAGVLVMLGVLIVVSHGPWAGFSTNPQSTTHADATCRRAAGSLSPSRQITGDPGEYPRHCRHETSAPIPADLEPPGGEQPRLEVISGGTRDLRR